MRPPASTYSLGPNMDGSRFLCAKAAISNRSGRLKSLRIGMIGMKTARGGAMTSHVRLMIGAGREARSIVPAERRLQSARAWQEKPQTEKDGEQCRGQHHDRRAIE